MNRAPGLDLLRAIAILWVMYYHAGVLDLLPQDDPVATPGWMGVDLFFALSGYLIGSQLLRPISRGEHLDPARFYLRRALRTFPAYLAVVALYFTVPIFRERPTIEPLWQFLTFTENLFIDFSRPRAFSHVWSLCVEEQFYLVAPVVIWLMARRATAAKTIALCLALLVGGMALRGYIWTHDLAPLQNIPHGHLAQRYQERIYYPTWTRLDGLLGGVALALAASFRPDLWARMMRRADLFAVAGVVCVLGGIWIFSGPRGLVPTVFGYPLVSIGMTALVAAAAGPTGILGRQAIPGAATIAAMAYSLYLTHKQIYHMVHVAVGASLDGRPVLAFLTYAGAAMAGGAILYLAVERPFLRLRERLGPGRLRPKIMAVT
ncbi:MAG TPA: acyltransferase [Phenylobacterium sp.]|jgi:peptidoglycan/LPS O-acetylase OafA/YrhL|uniref:acyltransferase family protein n=1 Tax=Phenylobacterium sp. TaxID=1871053 RepID=UPI002D2E9D94|nr:acyltransferase [Phenylobacterium sp.]HZZ67396.1 acyltransferase [Phenylobacterium sp.]